MCTHSSVPPRVRTEKDTKALRARRYDVAKNAELEKNMQLFVMVAAGIFRSMCG